VAVDPRTPCIIGVAQRTVRPPGPAPEPLDSWELVARAAAADAGVPDVLRDLESVQVVYCQSWPYDDPVGRLALRLGAAPARCAYSGIGGTTPQVLLDDTAERIVRGELDLGLVVGAEALATLRALRKAGERADWSHRDPERRPFPFEAAPVPTEVAHEVFQAYLTFPLFDTARRAARGDSLGSYAEAIGRMLAPMTEVAAANPHAWFPVRRPATELAEPSAQNRYVGWPYTKLEVAVMDVDMAAAVLLCSWERADALGVSPDKRVALRGWAYGTDCWTVAEREDMARSPAMSAVTRAALAVAGLGVDDVSSFDIYSCFPSSLHLAADALGIEPTDHRGLTVTGGLPYAGGPASDYVLHAVASMVERLRGEPGAAGLVTGVGMHMTKHVAAVYSTDPGCAAPAPVDGAALQATLDAGPRRTVVDGYDGDATVAALTVEHGRDGAAVRGLLVLDLPGGARAYGRVDEAGLLADAESRELVGAGVRLRSDGRVTTASW